ncbi:MAG: hypothetical protein OQK11_09760 [Thiovulaceae bacterium]|nr:hypothetical protein [Sulfurimonadaceae bacterium]
MDQLDLNQDTLRQRRNMVVTSVLVIFIKLADVTFGNSISFLGATLSIGNPEIIYKGILIFLAYFVWRFYQYFSTDKAYEALRNQYRKHMKVHTSVKIVQLICKPKNIPGLVGECLYKDLTKSERFTYSIEVVATEEYNPTTGDMVKEKFQANVPLIKIELYRFLYMIMFAFRGRIITDYFVPYLVLAYAVYIQFA